MLPTTAPAPSRGSGFAAVALAALLALGAAPDPERTAAPPPGPRFAPPPDALFADDFSGGMGRWTASEAGVWSVTRGMLRADLPDERQRHAFVYAGSPGWTDYAVDLDVCMMRGVDKGVVVRVEGESGIAVDLRGPGYQDVLMHRREWPMGRARAVNGNGVWHHLRVEASGHRYRVYVDGALALDREDGRRARPQGGIALPAYTGGGGRCTVYYDNVVVTPLPAGGVEAAAATAGGR
jgi:hypothetical protein